MSGLGYSDPFDGDALARVSSLDPTGSLTADWAWGGSTGAGVRVAVVDSGIDATHPAVGAVHGYVAITEGADGELVYDTTPHADDSGHGTACAGVIKSMAPDCHLISVKVLNARAAGKGRVLAAGLRWVAAQDVQVANLSLATTRREFHGEFHDSVDDAYFRRIAFVTAAHNRAKKSIPSLYSSVISVASHAVQDPLTFYYNPKPPVEFGALGYDVKVAWLNHTYTRATGNSFAAPHMAGLIARIMGKHPGLTVFQIKTILRELAANVHRDRVAPPPHLMGAAAHSEGG